MKTRITLVGARLSYNLGGPSLLAATKNVLDSYFENPEYTLIIPYKTFETDKELAPLYGIHVLPMKFKIWTLPMFLMRKFFRLLVGPQDQKDLVQCIEKADIVIDIWGIMYADTLNTKFLYRLTDGMHLWFSKIYKKPVIKYTAALGPFENKTNRFFAKFYLDKCTDLIIARDQESLNFLQKLQLKTPAHVLPDTAFLLDTLDTTFSKALAQKRKLNPVVCVSISYQANNREKKQGSYIETMVSLIKHISKSINAHYQACI